MEKFISNFDQLDLDKEIIENGKNSSEFTPVFDYLFNKGFRIKEIMAKALFVSYILKKRYCKNIEDFEVLYEAVYHTVFFAESIELWDSNYRMYDGLKGILLQELDQIELWKENR